MLRGLGDLVDKAPPAAESHDVGTATDVMCLGAGAYKVRRLTPEMAKDLVKEDSKVRLYKIRSTGL